MLLSVPFDLLYLPRTALRKAFMNLTNNEQVVIACEIITWRTSGYIKVGLQECELGGLQLLGIFYRETATP